MNPEELAALYPRLYHVTEPGAWVNIRQNGLLSTQRILNLYDIQGEYRRILETQRRPSAVTLEHVQYGKIVINDNTPLSHKALLQCLEDDLTPEDWLQMLNARVFFWPDEACLQRHLQARLNRHRVREVLVIDTLRLAKSYADSMELSPINSGATIRKAARRGLNTFTPLLQYAYPEWRKLRGYKDSIREITVLAAVKDVADFTLDVYCNNDEASFAGVIA